jgi:signal transduction histidine kinase
LNNAVKHGCARRITVDLSREPTSVRIRIKDSGHGFDPTAPGDGLGLPSMHERLRFIGGDLIVRSAPGVGTELVAEIRLPAEVQAADGQTNRGRAQAVSV